MVKKEHDRPSGMVARAVASDALSCSIFKCIIVIGSLTSLDACVHRRWCFEFDEPISLIGTYPLFPGDSGGGASFAVRQQADVRSDKCQALSRLSCSCLRLLF